MVSLTLMGHVLCCRQSVARQLLNWLLYLPRAPLAPSVLLTARGPLIVRDERSIHVLGVQEGFARQRGSVPSATHTRVCAGPYGNAQRGDVEIWVSKKFAWTDSPDAFPPGPDDITLWVAAQRFLIINVKVPYVCCDFVSVHLPSSWQPGMVGTANDVLLSQVSFLRELDRALSARKHKRPVVILSDLNAEVGAVVSMANDDYNAPVRDRFAAQDIVDLLEKFELCLPATYSDKHTGLWHTHWSPVHGYRRIDHVAVPQPWLLCVSAAFTDSTVDLRCKSEDHFLTCVAIGIVSDSSAVWWSSAQAHVQVCCRMYA